MENVSSRSAASFDIIVEICVIMCTEDHVSGAIDNAICEVSGAIIEYFIDGLTGVLRGGGLL